MKIKLEAVNDNNREAVLALRVREDQPFVASNEVSLRQAGETNARHPGLARPFAIYAEEKLVGFCMFAFNPEDEDEDDRYWLWRFMIDKRNPYLLSRCCAMWTRAFWTWTRIFRA